MNKGKVDPDRIYLMGGSMGGTGVWKMASAYPYLFAAVMPVAGNPDTVDAALLANTPVCTVMGTGDNLMDIAPVTSFMERLKELNGETILDVENGWSHIKTCTESYTDKRLNWIFNHIRSS